MTDRTTSPATAARLVKRHLRGMHVVFRGQSAYLCESEKRIAAGPVDCLATTTRMICQIENGDNIYGLRHVRAMREHSQLDAEMQRRIGAPTAERQYALDEASAEFKEEYVRQFVRTTPSTN